MYETSPGNGELIRHYLAAGRAYGSSLMYEVSRRQPVVSDFRPFVARGIPGMTFGMLDGPAYDHTAYDSIASFDEAGLQHEGETALALARRLGDADLWQLRAPDVVYFDLVGGVAVSYPGSYVLPFLALAAGALRRRRRHRRPAAPAHARAASPGPALGTGATLGRLPARGRHRLDDVPDRVRGARLDGHRRRDQRPVPARAGPAGVGRRPGRLRGAAAPPARLGPRRRRRSGGGRPAPSA